MASPDCLMRSPTPALQLQVSWLWVMIEIGWQCRIAVVLKHPADLRRSHARDGQLRNF